MNIYRITPTFKFLLHALSGGKDQPTEDDIVELLDSPTSIFRDIFYDALNNTEGLTIRDLQTLQDWSLILLTEHRRGK